ncbi:MAG TPA: HAMP domain-containing sensor histidine kinase [Anaerolineales bacterium]|nr:HAMP domain-containing sensor histidine kinase [Anaerolineales bacterium]
MPKKSWLLLALAFLPILLGTLLSLAAPRTWDPVPVLVFKIDVGMVAFLAGLLLTLFLLSFWIGSRRAERRARRVIEETLNETELGRRRFLRRLDHEMKNPLTGLRAALVNLQEAQSKDERIHAAENAKRAQERLTSLLNDLRKLSDLDERQIERERVDVPDLLDDVVDAARSNPLHEKRNINLFVTQVPSPFPCVIGDRDLLVLAMYNLVDNALKFTSAQEPVEVRALEDGKAIVVEVADSGGGIAPEDLPKVFEELYRGSNARGIEGSGLGLALVSRIVDLHGGQIEVRSRQENPRGTVFTVRLPEGR